MTTLQDQCEQEDKVIDEKIQALEENVKLMINNASMRSQETKRMLKEFFEWRSNQSTMKTLLEGLVEKLGPLDVTAIKKLATNENRLKKLESEIASINKRETDAKESLAKVGNEIRELQSTLHKKTEETRMLFMNDKCNSHISVTSDVFVRLQDKLAEVEKKLEAVTIAVGRQERLTLEGKPSSGNNGIHCTCPHERMEKKAPTKADKVTTSTKSSSNTSTSHGCRPKTHSLKNQASESPSESPERSVHKTPASPNKSSRRTPTTSTPMTKSSSLSAPRNAASSSPSTSERLVKSSSSPSLKPLSSLHDTSAVTTPASPEKILSANVSSLIKMNNLSVMTVPKATTSTVMPSTSDAEANSTSPTRVVVTRVGAVGGAQSKPTSTTSNARSLNPYAKDFRVSLPTSTKSRKVTVTTSYVPPMQIPAYQHPLPQLVSPAVVAIPQMNITPSMQAAFNNAGMVPCLIPSQVLPPFMQAFSISPQAYPTSMSNFVPGPFPPTVTQQISISGDIAQGAVATNDARPSREASISDLETAVAPCYRDPSRGGALVQSMAKLTLTPSGSYRLDMFLPKYYYTMIKVIAAEYVNLPVDITYDNNLTSNMYMDLSNCFELTICGPKNAIDTTLSMMLEAVEDAFKTHVSVMNQIVASNEKKVPPS